MAFDLSVFKEHPAITVAVFVVGAFVFYEIAIAGGSSPGQQLVSSQPQQNSGGVNPNTELAASVQMQSIQAGLQSQANQISANLSAQAADIASRQYLAKLSADTTLQGQTNQLNYNTFALKTTTDAQTSMHTADLSTQVLLTKENNATQITRDNIASNLSTTLANISKDLTTTLAQISSTTVLGLGKQQSDTTIALGGYQRDISISSINASRDIAVASADVQKHNADLGFLGGLIGAIL
jgi:hypothetical protein